MSELYFGWALHSTHCGSDSEGHPVFAMNVIMPGAGKAEEWWIPGKEEVMNIDDARAAFGELLIPWKWNAPEWNKREWTAFNLSKNKRGHGTWLKAPDAPANAAKVRTETENWLTNVTKGCKDAFSLQPDHVGSSSSLPHAVAPMTHLPAAVSDGVYAVSGHFAVTDMDANDQMAIFPSEIVADVQGSRREWKLGKVEARGSEAIAIYEEVVAAGGARLKYHADEVQIRFVSRPAAIEPKPFPPPHTPVVKATPLKPSELRQLIARHFHPVAIIAFGFANKTLDKDGKPVLDKDGKPVLDPEVQRLKTLDLKSLLAWSLGSGDIGAPIDGKAQRFADLLVVTARLSPGEWNPADTDMAKVVASAAALTQAFKDTPGFGIQFVNLLGAFLKAPSLDTLEPVVAAMMELHATPDTRLWAAWFKALTEKLATGTAAKRIAEKIDEKKRGFGRQALMHRLSALDGGNFWVKASQSRLEDVLEYARAQVSAAIKAQFGLDLKCDAAYQAALDALHARVADAKRANVLAEPGVTITFEEAGAPDQQIRGYCIAVQVGVGPSDTAIVHKEAGWITDTGLVLQQQGGNQTFEWLGKPKDPLIMAETIGSTYEAGLRVASVEYDGRPLLAALADENGSVLDPGLPESGKLAEFLIDDRWYAKVQMPPLGFGLWYRAAGVILDNAGGRWGATTTEKRTVLPDAAEHCKTAASTWHRYLSRVRPSAPVVTGVESWRTELSEETRAFSQAKPKSASDGRRAVVTLATGDVFDTRYTGPVSLQISPPLADRAFLERWNNADISEGVPSTINDRFNPAVSKILVRAFDESGKELGHALLDPKDNAFEIEASTRAFGSAGMGVAPGRFVRVEFASLVDATRVNDASVQRFHADIADPKQEFQKIDGKLWWVVAARDYWFEALPPYAAPKLTDDWIDLGVDVEPNAVVLALAGDRDAEWLRRFKLERHEWHWTGYDVRFPQEPNKEKLAKLVHTLINVGSYRETLESRNLETDEALAANPQPLHRFALPAVRGARFVAFSARPVLRFRKWLKAERIAQDELPVIAAGSVVPGASRAVWDRRVPVPAWSDSIPLCQTYALASDAQGGELPEYTRRANGSLLVFDEPIRRTDSAVLIGGIGETIELDVVETRTQGIFEQGVNPIFHALPNVPLKLEFTVSPPFGLTHDIGLNPKVAQTAVVVRPSNDALGKWLLCKARARRLYLPELMGDSTIALDKKYTIDTREEQECRVPADFCIDLDMPAPKLKVTLMAAGLKEDRSRTDLELTLPPNYATLKERCRLLVTWHKGRWTGEPTWRAQVLLQRPDPKRIGWQTLDRASPYSQKFDASVPLNVAAVDMTITPAIKGVVRRVMVSDYTEPQWLSFIGTFGRQVKAPYDYRLLRDGQRMVLEELQNGRWQTAQFSLKQPTRDNVLFQLLLLYDTRQDMMRGSVDETAGELHGWYQPDASPGEFVPFDAPPAGAPKFAYLLSFQRRNAGRRADLTTWPEVLKRMFPDNGEESEVRLLPEYLGPIAIQ